MEEKEEIKKVEYIKAPYAYTRTYKNLSLLQQNVMNRMLAHLQEPISKFFKTPELRDADKDPKPLFPENLKKNFPPIRVHFSELEISSATYARVRNAIMELMTMSVDIPYKDEEGKDKIRIVPMFSSYELPVHYGGTTVRKKNEITHELEEVKVDRFRSYVDININPALLDIIFDMNQGYVTHPENIARIASTQNMPPLYSYLRHKMFNLHKHIAQVDLMDIRDYFGMIERNVDNTIKEIHYPRYSQFKSRILTPALKDIEKLYNEGKIDVYFTLTEYRPRGKKIGDPEYLLFKAIDKKSEPKPEPSLFTEPAHEPRRPEPVKDDKREAEWGRVVAQYDGPLKAVITEIPYLGVLDGFPLLNPSKAHREQIEAQSAEWKKVLDMVRKVCGFSKYSPAVKFK